MRTENETRRVFEHDNDGAKVDSYAPRRMTLVENLILTVKVLGGFGLLGAALWGVSAWTSGR
jgi:hypothetical protein